jgi:periplasmic divalent cation tolerance protein
MVLIGFSFWKNGGIVEGAAMTDCSQVDIVTVTTTVGSAEDARRLARGLVEARLSACVQVDAIAASIYRWEGKLCEEPEWRLTIKTLPDRIDALQTWLNEHHPYEVPQFVAMPCKAGAAYAQWVRSEVA